VGGRGGGGGGGVRITAQLIQASNGSHLWSESYDREVRGIFQAQDEIAQAVVAALLPSLVGKSQGTPPATPVTSPDAYNMMAVVVVLSVVDLAWVLIKDIISPPLALLDVDELLDIFGVFLSVLIGIELLETLKTLRAREGGSRRGHPPGRDDRPRKKDHHARREDRTERFAAGYRGHHRGPRNRLLPHSPHS
jgi:hypothetical protein